MPITPDQAHAAATSRPDRNTARLFEDADEMLQSKQAATLENPSVRYSHQAIAAAQTAYTEAGWEVRYQPRGQFDVPELLIIRKRRQ